MNLQVESFLNLVRLRYSKNPYQENWMECCTSDIKVELQDEEQDGPASNAYAKGLGIFNLIQSTDYRRMCLESLIPQNLKRMWTWDATVNFNTNSIDLQDNHLTAAAEIFIYCIRVISREKIDEKFLLMKTFWTYDVLFSSSGLVSRFRESVIRRERVHNSSYPHVVLNDSILNLSDSRNSSLVPELIPESVPNLKSFSKGLVDSCDAVQYTKLQLIEDLRNCLGFFGTSFGFLLVFMNNDNIHRALDATLKSPNLSQNSLLSAPSPKSRLDEVCQELNSKSIKSEKNSDLQDIYKNPLAWIPVDADIDELSDEDPVRSNMSILCPQLEKFCRKDDALPKNARARIQQLVAEERRELIRSQNKVNAAKSRRRKIIFNTFLEYAIDALEKKLKDCTSTTDGRTTISTDLYTAAATPGAPNVTRFKSDQTSSHNPMESHYYDIVSGMISYFHSKHPQQQRWEEICDSNLQLAISCPRWQQQNGLQDLKDVTYDGFYHCFGLEAITSNLEERNHFLDIVWNSYEWNVDVKVISQEVHQDGGAFPVIRMRYQVHIYSADSVSNQKPLEILVPFLCQAIVNSQNRVFRVKLQYDVRDFMLQAKNVMFRSRGLSLNGLSAALTVTSHARNHQLPSSLAVANNRLFQSWSFLRLRASDLPQSGNWGLVCSADLVYVMPKPEYCSVAASAIVKNGNTIQYEGLRAVVDDSISSSQSRFMMLPTRNWSLEVNLCMDSLLNDNESNTVAISATYVLYDGGPVEEYNILDENTQPFTKTEKAAFDFQYLVTFDEDNSLITRLDEMFGMRDPATVMMNLIMQYQQMSLDDGVSNSNTSLSDLSTASVRQDQSFSNGYSVTPGATNIQNNHQHGQLLTLLLETSKRFVCMCYSSVASSEPWEQICVADVSYSASGPSPTFQMPDGTVSIQGIPNIVNMVAKRSQDFSALLPYPDSKPYTWTVDVTFQTDFSKLDYVADNLISIKFAYVTVLYASPLRSDTLVSERVEWTVVAASESDVTAVLNTDGRVINYHENLRSTEIEKTVWCYEFQLVLLSSPIMGVDYFRVHSRSREVDPHAAVFD